MVCVTERSACRAPGRLQLYPRMGVSRRTDLAASRMLSIGVFDSGVGGLTVARSIVS
jgi:hypothetical protein